MNPNQELLIRISPESQRIRLESTENGIVSYKEITDQILLDCISPALRHGSVDSGFLPPGCFHVTVNEEKMKHYCIWHSSLYANIEYFGTEYLEFPLPRLVFAFTVSHEGKVSNCKLGVIEDKTPTEDMKMFIYPFSNVGGFDLCIGRNTLPIYTKPHTLATLPNLLLGLPNNNHSFNPTHNLLGLPYRELLEHLKDKTPGYYYTSVLVESGKTLKDFVNGR